jgi:DNA polymerase-3 subunit gamma/tau
MYAASGPDRYKVYIVDEAHMLTREAWNALLKILEEPPTRVVFVFATTEPQKIAASAAPVMSRVQRFDFRRIGPQSIVERLKWVVEADGIDVEVEALQLIAHVADGGMRDGLSLLDQAVAFGDGTITAARVREALGLIDHETYAELLTLLAGKRTADVFPFVARLVEAGADLTEFVHGTGEVLRALLVKMLGGESEALTDSLRDAVEQNHTRFSAGDVLRMLKLLAATETSIRRSPNARLHVETLLLQWALLDRTVELTDVLDALGNEAQRSVLARSRTKTTTGRRTSDRRPSTAANAVMPVTQDDGSSLQNIAKAWPRVVEAVGRKRRMVREALSHAKPVCLGEGAVELEVSDCEVHLEGLERNKDMIKESIENITGLKVKSLVYKPQRGESGQTNSGLPARLDRVADQEERLKHHRQVDPGLDSLAEALDLEVLE